MTFCLVVAIPECAYAQSKIQRGTNSKKATTETVKKSTGDSKKQTGTPSKSSVSKKQASKTPANQFTFEITDISFANTDVNGKIIDPYDSKLYAKEIMYLKPRITYKSNNPDSQKITLSLKIYDESGNLKQGTGSPDGFTYSEQLQPVSTESQQYVMNGWGNISRVAYFPGVYRYEIWLDDKNIFEKSVRLYSGVPPIVDNSFFKINSATICSTDENNVVEISDPDDFYSQDVKYLTTKLNYTGLSNTEQTIPVYVRIFNSNGALMGGDKSPEGFTYKTYITIKPGENILLFSGWGNSVGGAYKPGNVRIEYWLDGEKIHEGQVKVRSDESKKVVKPDELIKARKEKDESALMNQMRKKIPSKKEHKYVDLGLPSHTLWAECNIGAESPDEFGNYFAWGEIEVKDKYTHNNSEYYNIDAKRLESRNIIDKAGNLLSKYDVATQRWGAEWKIPSLSQMDELVEKCKWEWSTLKWTSGFKVTGPNGNSIFLPASGWYNSASDGLLDCVNERSEYWCSTVVKHDNEDARCLFFMKPDIYYASDGHSVQRSRGLCVRPVKR